MRSVSITHFTPVSPRPFFPWKPCGMQLLQTHPGLLSRLQNKQSFLLATMQLQLPFPTLPHSGIVFDTCLHVHEVSALAADVLLKLHTCTCGGNCHREHHLFSIHPCTEFSRGILFSQRYLILSRLSVPQCDSLSTLTRLLVQ